MAAINKTNNKKTLRGFASHFHNAAMHSGLIKINIIAR